MGRQKVWSGFRRMVSDGCNKLTPMCMGVASRHMPSTNTHTENGHIADIYGLDAEGRLRHQPERAAALNAHIDTLRGKEFHELERLFQASEDPVEKEAILIYSIGHFHRDPSERLQKGNIFDDLEP